MTSNHPLIRSEAAGIQRSNVTRSLHTYRVWSDRQYAAVLKELCDALNAEIDQRLQLEEELAALRAELKVTDDTLTRTQVIAQQARYRANHDELTGLANRSYFGERLNAALSSDDGIEPVAVVYLDLDDFKAVNDGHGHDAGDDLLKIVAARLSRVVRSEDLLSRLGGDEFACIVAGGLNKDQLSRFAFKLHDALANPCRIGQLTLKISPSIGIARCPEDAATAEELLKKADSAMYAAKRAKSRFEFC